MPREQKLKTDRSGMTLKDYRDLYWFEKKRRKELEAAAEMKNRRIDWTVQDNAKKAIKITELEEALESAKAFARSTYVGMGGRKAAFEYAWGLALEQKLKREDSEPVK